MSEQLLTCNVNERTHVDCFSGIGGFTLAAESCGLKTILFVECDENRKADLNHHWPGVPIVSDVNDTDAICGAVGHASRIISGAGRPGRPETREENPTSSTGSLGTVANGKFSGWGSDESERHVQNGQETERREGANGHQCDCQSPFLVSAGVPCPPASCAGKRLGSRDHRWLWPQTIRLVDRLRPCWLLFENPLGLASLAEPAAIPSVDLERLRGMPGRTLAEILRAVESLGYDLPRDRDGIAWVPCVPAASVGAFHKRDRLWIIGRRRDVDLSHATVQGEHQEGDSRGGEQGKGKRDGSTISSSGCLPNWSDATLERGADGVWRATKPGLRLLAHGVPRRTSKLAGFGNAIVPQVAQQIIAAMIQAEEQE